MEYKFQELASRLTGISIPIFGIQWTPPEPERKIVRDLLIFLEDRRVLYNPNNIEVDYQVTDSVVQIRKELTDSLKRLNEKSNAIPSIRVMRSACRRYLDSTQKNQRYSFSPAFLIPLGELRATFGLQIAYLAIQYGIDIEGDLATILPSHLTQDD